MASESLKAFLFGMVKESGKGGEAIPLPETPSTGDQEHGGEASDAMETPRDDGPDEFAAHVEAVRGAWPDGPPMIAQDMPDYYAFCSGYFELCDHCPHYVNSGTGLFCSMWEAVYPGRVMWHSIN